MDIQNLEGMGSYLGLPEDLGGSKIQVFSFVQERLNSRVMMLGVFKAPKTNDVV